MSNDPTTASSLVPPLRFPEFYGEWQVKNMGQLYEFKRSNSLSRENLNYVSGFIKNIHYGDIHTKYSVIFDIVKEKVPYINSDVSITSYKLGDYCREGDIIFADASEDHDGIGKSIEISNLNDERVVSGLHTILARQIDMKFALGFGGYLFQSEFVRKQIQRESQGAKVLGISTNRLMNVHVLFPSLPEQRKIADCLSSLDEVIEAQTQKLEVLKRHKKALMQRLFPLNDAGGGVIPSLRFPEFKNASEWKIRKIGEISEILRGQNLSKNDLSLHGKNFCIHYGELFTEYNDIIRNVTSKTNIDNGLKSKMGDILMPSSDITPEGLGKASVLLASEILLGNDMNVIRLKKDHDPRFINYLINFRKQDFISVVSGTTVKHLYAKDLVKVKIAVAVLKEEQRKIADCLSSLDEVIEAKASKITHLKNHKKSLTQQLFPNM